MKKCSLNLTIAIFILLLVACNNSKKKQELNNEKIKVVIIEPENSHKGSITGVIEGCGYNYSPNQENIQLYQPRQKELNQIHSILKFSGLSSNFIIYGASINNAVATIINDKRYILYDPQLLSNTDQQSGSYWSSMSILAHEIGHHLSGHTITNKGSNLINELEADKFSGFILYKLGASISQATAAMRELGGEYNSDTHPSKYKRIKAITEGWNEASQQRYESAVPPPPADDENFGEEGYIKDEFTKEELISESALEDNTFGGAISRHNYPFLEGIIIDVTKEDPSGGGRTESFNEQKSEFNMVVTIQLTAIGSSNFEKNSYKIGERRKFNLLDYYQMSHADLSWFEALMVPGRKIRFKSFYFGYGAEDIFYIKKLNRNGSEVTATSTVSDNYSSESTYTVLNTRAFFYTQPNSSYRKNAYLVYGQVVKGKTVNKGFVYCEFFNSKGKKTTGWLQLLDLTPTR